jgi:hypothetical protein
MSKHPTPQELENRTAFYSAVGQGISNWARMETRLIHIAAHLLDSDNKKTGVVFYSIANFNTWLSVIEDLLSLDKHLASIRRDWTKLAARLRGLNDIRVRLAHHTAWHGDYGREISLRPAREDQRPKSLAYEPLTAPEIIKFTRATYQIAMELMGLLARLKTARMAL